MLKQRIITAVAMLITFVIITVVLSPFFFALLISLLMLVAVKEWVGFIGLTQPNQKALFVLSFVIMIVALFGFLGISPTAASLNILRVRTILGFGLLFWVLVFFLLKNYPKHSYRWNDKSKIAVMGVFSLIPLWLGLIQLKYSVNSGYMVLLLVALVSSVDIGAYFAGTTWGHRKLAPQLSPKKTWEGFWGGVSACILISVVSLLMLNLLNIELLLSQSIVLLLTAILLAVFSVAGDLFVSMLKRNQGLKDTGNILPGHGGLLDRIDSLAAATPVFVLALSLIIPE